MPTRRIIARFSLFLLVTLCAPGVAWAGPLSFGAVTFLGLPQGQGARGIAVGDVNGDGIPDIVAAFNVGAFPNNASRFAVFLGTGGGAFGPATVYDPGVGCWTGGGTASAAIELADVNHDGFLDVLMGHGGTNASCAIADKLTIHLGDGTGNFPVPGIQLTTTPGVTGAIGVGDFNGDGHLDLVTSSPGQTVLHAGAGNGTFGAGVPIAAIGGIIDLVVGDFNKDGRLDLAGVNGSAVRIIFGTGTGSFSGLISFPIDYAQGLAKGDFNDDGFVDLAPVSRLISGQEGTFQGRANILLGATGGVFSNPVGFADGPNTKTIAVADFDGDGHLDLAVGHFSFPGVPGPPQSAVSVLRGDGTGSFSAPIVFLSPFLREADGRIRTADFNGDGKPDVVVTCAGGVCVLLNTTQSACEASLAAAEAEIVGLQGQLTTAQAEKSQCQADLSAAQTTIQSLQGQVQALQSELNAAEATIEALVDRLFGLPPDLAVATAARDAAQKELNAAIAAFGATDPRVRRAQQHFNRGLTALAAGDFRRAVREFREAFNIARRRLGG